MAESFVAELFGPRPMHVADLESHPFFEGCDDPERAVLASVGHIEVYDPGDVVLREGEPADTFRLVAGGQAALSIAVPTGPDLVVSAVAAGDLLGWSSLLPGRAWAATATALTRLVVLAFPAEALLDLCDKDPRLASRLLHESLAAVGRRLADTRLELAEHLIGRSEP